MPDDVLLAFTTLEARRLTGVTARRLQYWDETSFIRPSVAARKGRGSPRLYSFRDLVQLRVAAQLRDQLSLQALRRLKTALDVDAPFAAVRFAVTPSHEVIYIGPTGQPEAAKAPGQILMTVEVPLREIRTDLEGRIDRLRSRHRVGKVESARGVLGGRPRVAGTRISPKVIERLLIAGWTSQRILDEYPELRLADIKAVSSRRGAQAS